MTKCQSLVQAQFGHTYKNSFLPPIVLSDMDHISAFRYWTFCT